MAFADLSRIFRQNLEKIIIGIILLALILFLIWGEIKPAIEELSNKIAGGT